MMSVASGCPTASVWVQPNRRSACEFQAVTSPCSSMMITASRVASKSAPSMARVIGSAVPIGGVGCAARTGSLTGAGRGAGGAACGA